jgi:hypothetical protein
VIVPVVEEVYHLEAQRGEDFLRFASGEALEERPTVLALRDGQARVAIFVGGAQRLVVVVAPLPHAFQPIEDEVHRHHRASPLAPPGRTIITTRP